MIYDKLTPDAKSWCDTNDFKTDEKLTEVLKELRISLRIDYGVSHSEYKKMNPSQIIERFRKESANEVFYGS